MATHTLQGVDSQLTLVELAKRTLDGQHLAIAEVLAETNEVLADAVWIESNQPTSHITSKRTHLPSGTWRKIGGGVKRETTSTKQIEEGVGLCEAYSLVDKFLVDIAKNPREFRSQEDLGFVEGLSQTLADTLFKSDSGTIYGTTTGHPERFNGFVSRYNKVSGNDNVRDQTCSDSNQSTSLWVIQWSPRMVHMIYPKGSKMGIEARDLGEQTVTASDSPSSSPSEYQAYRTHFKFNAGLAVRDDRCVQRLANIDPNDTANADGLSIDNVIFMLNDLPYQGKNAVIYCNRAVKADFHILAKDSGNLAVQTVDDAFGKPVQTFLGVPIRRVDAITNTENPIS